MPDSAHGGHFVLGHKAAGDQRKMQAVAAALGPQNESRQHATSQPPTSSSGVAAAAAARSTLPLRSVSGREAGGRGDDSEAGGLLTVGKASRKGRKASPFKPRSSRLDPETLDREQDAFRGFFTLFWIGMAFHVLVTAFSNVAQNRAPFGTRLFNVFSQDAFILAVSDFTMVAATFVAPAVQMLVVRGWLRRPVTLVFQHVYQFLFLFAAIMWSFWRNFPWTASGFFALHTIAMLMKLHSYFTTNADLDAKSRLFTQIQGDLAALRDGDDGSQNVVIGATTGHDIARARDSRKRRFALRKYFSAENVEESSGKGSDAAVNFDIKTLEEELERLKEDLTVGNTTYPHNVTFMNFVDYLAVPTLVYELDYPRTERVRKHYLFQKFAATAACFLLLYNTIEHYIMPVLEETLNISFVHSVVSLLFPFMVCYLLIFYIIFEAICGFFAELTRFADRNFYDDWWNSVTYDEFARKWNKPVHVFLLRHVYYDSMEHYRISRSAATYLTFALSSAVHELVFVVVGRRIRMYMFAMQMLQLPLIWLGRKAAFREHKWAGNAFFWFGMFMGPPLLAALYCREAYLL